MSDKSPTCDWQAYLDCQCYSKEHMIVLEYDREFGLMLNVQARMGRGFWARLKAAIKYVFTPKGVLDWDGVMFRPEDTYKVEEWLNQVKEHGPGTEYEVKL